MILPSKALWTMPFYLMLIFVGLPGASIARADDVPAKPDTAKAGAKEDLRYDGKDFAYWRSYLLTELKNEKRLEALKAIKVFSVHGYDKETTETILEIVKNYKGSLTDNDEKDFFETTTLILRGIAQANEPLLVDALSSPNKNVGLYVSVLLEDTVRTISKAAVPGLIQVVDGDDSNTWVAVSVLTKVEDIETEMKKALKDEKQSKAFAKAMTKIVRESNRSAQIQSAVILLRGLGTVAEDAAPALLDCLKAPDPFDQGTSVRVIEALEKIGVDPDSVISALSERLAKDENAWSTGLASCLGRFGASSMAIIPELRESLANANPDICLNSFVALVSLGEDPHKMAPTVIESLKMKISPQLPGSFKPLPPLYRRSIYRFLQSHCEYHVKAFVPILIQCFETFPEERLDIASALGEFGPVAKEAVPVLSGSQKDTKDPELRREVVNALRKIQKEDKDQPKK